MLLTVIHPTAKEPQMQYDTQTTQGLVLYPGEPGWDAARATFNLNIDQRPAAIAMPQDEHDVAAAIRHAADSGLQVTAQATGHGAATLGSLQRTLIINTSRLTGVEIDAEARLVRVGAGTKWEKVTPALSELGLAALHGTSPDVGVVGYSLGGGLGWMGRRYGLQCNSVTAIEVVTSDGLLIRCDHEHEPELFWALRGGGGNFGVVTAIEFRVYPVERVYAGALFFPFARAGEIVSAWHELLPSLPHEVTSQAAVMHFPDVPSLPEPLRGGSFAVVSAAVLGDEPLGRELLRPIRDLGPLVDTFAVAPPVVLGDLSMDPPEPLPYDTTHALLDGLSGDALDGMVAAAGPSSGIIVLQLRHLAGALGRESGGAGALPKLPGTLAMFAVGLIAGEESAATLSRSFARVEAACAPHQIGRYANFVESPVDASALYDAACWARLSEVKALYDPADLIRGSHHIRPSR
jgi:hypothetical protein